MGVNSATKEQGSVISFGSKDMEGIRFPHNNALVIQVKVTNYEIQRIFVDSGSSFNVIFQEAFDQMNLHRYRLDPIDTTFFGFTSHIVYPKGKLILPLTVGMGEVRKKVIVMFTIFNSPSSSNIILGNQVINAFRDVASTYHLEIKFSVENQLAEVRGDQPSSRKCCAKTVRVN